MGLPIVIHPIAECHKKASAADLKKIAQSIAESGLENQIRFIKKDKQAAVIDGKTRIAALESLGVDPWKQKTRDGLPAMVEIVVPDDADEISFLAPIEKNLNDNRRHETASDKATAGAKLVKLLQAEEKERAAREREEAKANPEAAKPKPTAKPKPSAKGESSNTARGKAAKATGASPKNIQNKMFLDKNAPELAKKVEDGDITINQAMSEHKKAASQQKVAAAAKEAEKLVEDTPVLQVITVSDCCEGLRSIVEETVQLVITDPPYNQGINYGNGAKDDAKPVDEYYAWLKTVWAECFEVLDKTGTMLVIIPTEHQATVDLQLQDQGFHIRSRIVMVENFGTYVKGNFGKCHRTMLYAVKDRKKFTMIDEHFMVESKRQQMGDNRANPDGKFMPDVIDYTRICGTFKERIEGFPTQLSVAFVQKFVNGMSLPGDLVCDPFSGSGTVAEACIFGDQGQRQFIGFDKNKKYVELANQRLTGSRAKLAKQK